MSDMVTLWLHASGRVGVRVNREAYELAKAAARVGSFLGREIRDIETDVEVHEPDGTIVDVETGAIFPPPPPVYLIRKLDDRTWWKPESSGYTTDVWQAGRYSADEALEASRGESMWHLIVPAPESGRSPFFDASELAGIEQLMEDRIDAVKAGVDAAKEQVR